MNEIFLARKISLLYYQCVYNSFNKICIEISLNCNIFLFTFPHKIKRIKACFFFNREREEKKYKKINNYFMDLRA